jgi:cytochrome b6-f complex iron-sulfur subunit
MDSAAVFRRLGELSRREMLSRGLTAAGWGSFAVVLGTGTIETLRFFFPRVLFQPPSRVRIGPPREFVTGAADADVYGVAGVDERWKATQRFFVVRERDRLYALSARCAHLGCTVNWFGDLRAFKCPCHGSEYHSNGVHFAGPAPRPLDRLAIELNVDGELVVDTAIVYGPERFHVDGAFVRL